MEIDRLINILTNFKNEGIEHVQVLRKTEEDNLLSSEDFSCFCYELEFDTVIIIPEYL